VVLSKESFGEGNLICSRLLFFGLASKYEHKKNMNLKPDSTD